MKLPMFQIDAFTDRLFAGNPAAVVILERWLPDALLLAIAAENNLAETAFVIPGAEISQLRWFTPGVEMDLCGHATLATAFVLFRELFPAQRCLRFTTCSGELQVEREGTTAEARLCLDFPARPGLPVGLPLEVVRAIGGAPLLALQSRDLMLVYGSEAEVRALQPDFRQLAALPHGTFIVTAAGEAVDFVSRFFAPGCNVEEDPVTGSAHCTLIPYWAERFGKTSLHARQLSLRGGELWCELRGERVRMSGQAVEFLRGEIRLDPALLVTA